MYDPELDARELQCGTYPIRWLDQRPFRYILDGDQNTRAAPHFRILSDGCTLRMDDPHNLPCWLEVNLDACHTTGDWISLWCEAKTRYMVRGWCFVPSCYHWQSTRLLQGSQLLKRRPMRCGIGSNHMHCAQRQYGEKLYSFSRVFYDGCCLKLQGYMDFEIIIFVKRNAK